MPKKNGDRSPHNNISDRVYDEVDRRDAERRSDTAGKNFWLYEIEKSLVKSYRAATTLPSRSLQYAGERHEPSLQEEQENRHHFVRHWEEERQRLAVLIPFQVEKESEDVYRVTGDMKEMSDNMLKWLQSDIGRMFDIKEELWGLRLTQKNKTVK